MIDLDFVKEGAGFNTGNVIVMLGMLESIHDEASDDEVLAQFADTVASAIGQLRDLQQLAYQTMIEIEADRATGRSTGRLRLLQRTPS